MRSGSWISLVLMLLPLQVVAGCWASFPEQPGGENHSDGGMAPDLIKVTISPGSQPAAPAGGRDKGISSKPDKTANKPAGKPAENSDKGDKNRP